MSVLPVPEELPQCLVESARLGPNLLPADVQTEYPVRRWTINGDFLGLKPTGVARFGREVTIALDALFEDGHPLTRGLALDIIAPRRPVEPLALRRLPLSIVPEFRLRFPQVWVQLQLPRHLRGGLLSFCNLAPILAERHIVCIHDLQTRTVPQSYGRFFRWAHRAIIPALGKRADFITTVSEFSKTKIIEFGIAPPQRIAVVYNGSDHARRWKPGGGSLWRKASRPLVLCIGRDEAHKNMELVWQLAQPLDECGIDVVVAGEFDRVRLDALGWGAPHNIRCLGRISDDELAEGFREALCFLFPSRSEGFGLPAMEAMSCGCPVVASTAACLPEICGDGALFADPDDVEAWVAAVRHLVERPDARERLRQQGLMRSARYSWRRTALRYLRLMRQVDTHRDGNNGPLVDVCEAD